jgi:hypothetical protein
VSCVSPSTARTSSTTTRSCTRRLRPSWRGYARTWTVVTEAPVAAVVTALGAYMSGLFGRSFFLGWASTRWPRTTGEVRRSEVVVTDLGVRQGRSNLEGAAHVLYVYDVNGETYFGHRIQFGPEWWWFAGRDARAYPPGRAVEVAYDPRRPTRSVLRPGLTWSNALALPLSAGVLTGGLTWLLRSLGTG